MVIDRPGILVTNSEGDLGITVDVLKKSGPNKGKIEVQWAGANYGTGHKPEDLTEAAAHVVPVRKQETKPALTRVESSLLREAIRQRKFGVSVDNGLTKSDPHVYTVHEDERAEANHLVDLGLLEYVGQLVGRAPYNLEYKATPAGIEWFTP
jgi:hypothetical protein